MPSQPNRPCFVASIIERADNHILIALPSQPEPSRLWILPRGLANPGESAEAAMRRIARDQLGLFVELVIGQPPILCEIDGKAAEVRYFFCGVSGGEAGNGPYSEIRWVPRAHLREYEFDTPCKAVVEWLLSA